MLHILYNYDMNIKVNDIVSSYSHCIQRIGEMWVIDLGDRNGIDCHSLFPEQLGQTGHLSTRQGKSRGKSYRVWTLKTELGKNLAISSGKRPDTIYVHC